MFISRDAEPKIVQLAQKFPVITIVGPRQSGKTTLSKEIFNTHAYVSLEDFDVRHFAQQDPRGFFQTYDNGSGILIDEIQHVPELLSYIQTMVDADHRPARFILTGSQNILVGDVITQTLAGRVAIVTLLPLSIHELKQANLLPHTSTELLLKGLYPRIYAHNIMPRDWYPNYIYTYLERDVRSIKLISDLSIFQRFVKLCAGRIGQLLNITSLANDCGISVATTKSWLSLLEASYFIFLLQPHHINFSKRLIKSPKLYFYDTGLACSLLDITSTEQLATHYLLGGLFESLVVSEFFKQRFNKGLAPQVYFWRDKMGNEIDCLLERESKLIPIEIKAGKTISGDYFKGLEYWNELAQLDASQGLVVYAGDQAQKRSYGQVVSWRNIPDLGMLS